jgi:nucleoside 2-deoxyribosyltransferase
MKIYLAGPLFSTAETLFNNNLAVKLTEIGHEVWLPQDRCYAMTDPKDIYNDCLAGVGWCDVVLAVLDGADADSGTCFECGYAKALEKPIVGLRTDFRKSGDNGGLNLMLSQCTIFFFTNVFDLVEYFK